MLNILQSCRSSLSCIESAQVTGHSAQHPRVVAKVNTNDLSIHPSIVYRTGCNINCIKEYTFNLQWSEPIYDSTPAMQSPRLLSTLKGLLYPWLHYTVLTRLDCLFWCLCDKKKKKNNVKVPLHMWHTHDSSFQCAGRCNCAERGRLTQTNKLTHVHVYLQGHHRRHLCDMWALLLKKRETSLIDYVFNTDTWLLVWNQHWNCVQKMRFDPRMDTNSIRGVTL